MIQTEARRGCELPSMLIYFESLAELLEICVSIGRQLAFDN